MRDPVLIISCTERALAELIWINHLTFSGNRDTSVCFLKARDVSRRGYRLMARSGKMITEANA
jgi:hypothetical protein